jgi:hypothetical protein
MSLLALQRDFRSWLTREAVDAGARLEAAPAPGLPIYLNNYRSSLISCLAESFEITRAWLGDEAFEAAAAIHIDRLPPHSWTLDAYALDFPASLALRYPNDPEVAELARLECALSVAFVGADADAIDPATLTDVDWDMAVLRFVPTLTLLDVTTNIAAIWSAITAEEKPPAAALLPEPASIAIWRNDLTPAFRTLDTEEAGALSLMMSGLRFGDLCAVLVEQHGEQDGPAMAGALLGQWLRDGIVRAIASSGNIIRACAV